VKLFGHPAKYQAMLSVFARDSAISKAINWLDAEDTFFDFMENSLNFK
jgi:hypothetical protein